MLKNIPPYTSSMDWKEFLKNNKKTLIGAVVGLIIGGVISAILFLFIPLPIYYFLPIPIFLAIIGAGLARNKKTRRVAFAVIIIIIMIFGFHFLNYYTNTCDYKCKELGYSSGNRRSLSTFQYSSDVCREDEVRLNESTSDCPEFIGGALICCCELD